MTVRFLLNSEVRSVILIFPVFVCFLPGAFSSGTVTLTSIQIFKTHEWLSAKPTIYFQCQGENKTILPDVTEAHHIYVFKGEESWQPLTELADKKCKRCGLYEKDIIKADAIFDEWELCPSDFMAPDGNYVHSKDKEFNATFLCSQCVETDKVVAGKGINVVWVIMISVLVSVASILGAVAAYKYWRRKKREHDQARFLKLFDEGDDIEDEIGIGDMI
ncbi:PREDICTED: uncharacterized protein LOC104599227 [Nelumbo nucifera]|uniref:Uncharacterized protein LOC104599227 n=1 Tax=Nelumbo nucifera TaxID=4432 RepID=A0A1U8ACT2_NELNU|nr:PREDICTED: uncharacterized protein LOC104599227 [Nelumbo nucifera]